MTNSTSKTTVQLSRFLKFGLVVAASAVIGFASLAQTPAPAAAPKSGAQSGTTATKKPAASSTAAHAATYDHTLLHPSLLKDKAPDTYVVKFVTTRGDFTVTVKRASAPLGADRFYNLVKHHFYDNAVFFRTIPNFVTQFGISSYPPVSAAWKKTEFKDDPVTETNKKGSIVFATAGANTRTTQVFINLKDNTPLDKSGFAPFGTVDGDGMKIVEMLYDQYGDNIDQEQVEKTGKAYLDKSFPKLDVIKSATIISPAPAATPTAKPKAASTTPKATSTTPKPKPAATPNQ
jgi:peptidyl-prolyl cis-trans isomerase A (cyclophilin A)